VLLAGTALVLGRAAAQAQTPAASPVASWQFMDDRGIAVELPVPPERIVAEINAASALWDYGVRPVGVFGPQHRTDGSVDARVGNVDLASVTDLGEVWGEVDIEGLLALDTDLVVGPTWDPPEIFYLTLAGEAALGDRVPVLGIHTARVSLDKSIQRFAELAGALGADLDSEKNTAARVEYASALEDLENAIAENPDLAVLFVAGDDTAFYVAQPDDMADLILLQDLGLNILSGGETDFWETLSWEDVQKFPADLILVDTREGSYSLDDFAAVPTWSTVPAVQAGQVDVWHAEPIYSYAGYAPELRRLAGLIRDARSDVA
jgi:iron complex transport system substrate-binding protein